MNCGLTSGWVRVGVAGGLLMALAGSANAQHAGFVLFGEPNPAAARASLENKFVHPISGPYFHEDSFITTDVRTWLLYHKVDEDIALGGGHAMVAAAQIRVALTNWLQLVAYKDGYTWLSTPGLETNGANDIAAGLKFAVIQDFESNFHLSLGAGYQFPWGDPSALQNDGEVRLWGSVNKGFGPFHVGATFNYFIHTSPTNGDLGNSDRISWHLHGDYRLCDWFSPVLEFNGYHNLTENSSPLAFHGADVGNFGTGLDDPVITTALGFEVRPIEKLGFRAAFELPLTGGDQLFGWRVTLSMVLSF
ncbi:MAG: hypothetical protein KIT68_11710 [Phycisphaeraceae bacterium]|nr:hypothetical protein [Phycisphaeraceae bacterium]